MSLKAKLEAVIYAAEEPVTLAQLTGLFAEEALEWKAEQDAAAQANAQESAGTKPLLNESFGYLELEQGPGPEGESATESAAETEAPEAEASAPVEDATGQTAAEAEPLDEAAAIAAAEADARKFAKTREREARSAIKQILDELVAEYAADGRGIEVREIAGGYRMATKPEFHDAVRLFVKSLKPALKLSLPALETLAVIAYKQPVTAPEVNEIRGVDSSGVFGSLLARKLIVTAGRKQVVGRPILYKTTREFLLRFGLKDVSELPSMEEFEKMAASELADPGTEPEEPGAPEVEEEFSADLSVETEEAERERMPEGEPEAPAEVEAGQVPK